MKYLPNDSTPHYAIDISVIIDKPYSAFGQNTKPTIDQFCDDFAELTKYKLVSHLWGVDAVRCGLLNVSYVKTPIKNGWLLNVKALAPLDFNRDELTMKLQQLWVNNYGAEFSSYALCRRIYSTEELNSLFCF